MAEEENVTLPLHDKEVYMHVLHKILVYIQVWNWIYRVVPEANW